MVNLYRQNPSLPEWVRTLDNYHESVRKFIKYHIAFSGLSGNVLKSVPFMNSVNDVALKWDLNQISLTWRKLHTSKDYDTFKLLMVPPSIASTYHIILDTPSHYALEGYYRGFAWIKKQVFRPEDRLNITPSIKEGEQR
jgi:hypothetical protein